MSPPSQPLPQFIRKNLGSITDEWAVFAKTLMLPYTSDLILRDHIHQILFFIADDIESMQTEKQQVQKSQGKSDNKKPSPGELHGKLRFDNGMDLIEMVSEYRALRASIITHWTKTKIVLTDADLIHLVRFNESIDQLLVQSIGYFVQSMQKAS